MKRVCVNWNQAVSAGNPDPSLFEEFAGRAKAAGAELFHVNTFNEAKDAVVNLVKYTNARKVVAVDNLLAQAAGINAALRAIGVDVYTDAADVRVQAATADIGLTGVEFAIAESGSVCQDAYAVESRLVSTLPPIHVVFLNSNNILKGIGDAMKTISPVFNSGYVSFITGPSRTADIERVLTIGVHGPGRFIIIDVDEQVTGGAAL